jgi:uncharacterized protein YifE (UPF0438 family)
VPQGGFKNQWQYCVKEEEATRGPVFSNLEKGSTSPANEHECRIEDLRYPERGHVTYNVVCGKKAMRIQTDYRYTETTFEGTTHLLNEGQRFTHTIKGRHVGPCKP